MWKNADSVNLFSIAGLGRNKCCMWAWRHLPGALFPRSSFWCFATIGSYIQRFHDKFLIFVWKNADSTIIFLIAGLGLNKCCEGHCYAGVVFGVFPPFARKFNGFMTSFWFLYEKMLTQWICSLDSGARARNKCCMWAWRHLRGALLRRSSFWCFSTICS